MPFPIIVDGKEGYDYSTNTFVTVERQELELEHCLLAISKWEAKWKKPFLDGKKRTSAELISYISFMPLNEKYDPNFVIGLTPEQIKDIYEYIDSQQTATIIAPRKQKGPKSNELLTAELMYYYMAQVPLPFEICERWHFSRLLKILEIAAIKSDPNSNKKMPSREWASKQRALNEARKARLHTRG